MHYRASIVMIILLGMSGGVATAAEDQARTLVTAFWTAGNEVQRQEAARNLREAARDTATLYRWLRGGPEFAADVPTGIVEGRRLGADGLSYPYVVLVPETYDPSRSYPVDFMLHGGVSRPAQEDGEVLWRRGYESLQQDDRIVVVPAAWNETFWWYPNQAENLPAILQRIKRDYNVDDNRVYLIGVSDGGTGAYFFAFKQPTEWAAFFPYIGHPGVLSNPAGRFNHKLYFENVLGRPFYIVNGEEDPLYPAAAIQPFVKVLDDAGIDYVFRVIEGGGHNTNWLPEETESIERFRLAHPRDPFPDSVQWVTDSTQRFNRYHWVRIDELERDGQPGMVRVERSGNSVRVDTVYVDRLTLLLNPDEIDLTEPVAVYLNGSLQRSEVLSQDAGTLLDWAGRELDRSMLYTVELTLSVGER